jgi:HK97 family phage prohead protease
VTEYRAAPESVKIADESKHQVVIDAPVYGVVDDYRTAWKPGVFSASIDNRKPSLLWSHDWKDPIGAFHDAEERPDRLRIVYQLDDFDAVPRARQAFAQAKSGTIRDASFGFDHQTRDESPFEGDEHAVWINRAALDEHSMVLKGAVPGAGVVGVRQVPVADVLRLAAALEAGEMSLDEALSTVTRIAMSDETRAMHVHAKQDGSGTERHSHAEQPANHGHPGSGLMPAYALKLGRAAPGIPDNLPAPGLEEVEDETEGTVTCPNCGAQNPADALTCEKCGAELPEPSRVAIAEARQLLEEIER